MQWVVLDPGGQMRLRRRPGGSGGACALHLAGRTVSYLQGLPEPLQPLARLHGHGLKDHLVSGSPLSYTQRDLDFPSGISDSFISLARMSQGAKSQSFHSPGQLPVPSQDKLTSLSLAHPSFVVNLPALPTT